jgi:hypothetical protein
MYKVPDCGPNCGCTAWTAKEAVSRTAQFIGMDPEQAAALIALLREYGWELTNN